MSERPVHDYISGWFHNSVIGVSLVVYVAQGVVCQEKLSPYVKFNWRLLCHVAKNGKATDQVEFLREIIKSKHKENRSLS